MEIFRSYRALKPLATGGGVLTAEEAMKWQGASLGPGFLRSERYAAMLTRQSDPSVKVYGTVINNKDRITLDIPLMEHTPVEVLRQQAAEATFFGEIDPDKFRTFVTGDFITDKLLAYLNRTQAGVLPEAVPAWFHKAFGLEHLEHFSNFYIGSHGGSSTYGYTHHATIEPKLPRRLRGGRDYAGPHDFTEAAQQSIPHLRISPLPVETLMQGVQATLQFQPQYWK